MAALLTVIWFAGCGYASIPCFWFAAHPFAAGWRRRRQSPYYILLPVWALIIAGIMAASRPWHRLRWYATPVAWVAGLGLVAAGFWMYRQAHRDFSDAQIIGRPELEAGGHEQRLVTSGIRSRLRHPIYVGHLLVLAGLAAGSGLAVLWVLLAIDLALHVPLIQSEEAELESRFGEEYREYRSRVPAMIPRPGGGRRSADAL
ncbi:MAG: isoprenylcysteine carboxylmethyltransferase family protein [Acidobacteria bacterium]|nr:isoprenylcysteine carboxylmethyltransferase family protein [Acidobacteriota bacterium]